MKLRNKVITILIIIITCFSTISMATIDPDKYKPSGLDEGDYVEVFSMASTIINAITIVGVVISVIMVMVLGIKYMAGSVEEKAEYKKTMIPMLIGAILLFASSTIVSIIYQLVQNLE